MVAATAVVLGCAGLGVAEQTDTKPLFMTMRLPLAGIVGRIDRMTLVPEDAWPEQQGQPGGTVQRGMGGGHGRLFVAATSEGMVEGFGLNLDSFYLKQPELVEPQGVAWMSEVKRLAVACGDGTLKLYEPVMGLGEYTEDGRELPAKPALKEVASIRLAGEAEDLAYDASKQTLYVAHGRGVSAIDPHTGEKHDKSAKLDGHAEDLILGSVGGKKRLFACVARPSGKDEKGVEAKPHVAVIDPETMEVVERWALGTSGSAGKSEEVKECFAMTLDEPHARLFVACRRPAVMVVLDTASGKPVTTLACAPGADGVAYDAKGGYVFVTGGEQGGKVSVFKQKSADEYELANTIDTLAGASTCLFDQQNRLLLVVAPGLGQQAGYEQSQATLLHYEVR